MCDVCRFAGSRLAGQRSVAGWVGETMGGLTYLESIRTLSKRVEEDWPGVQVRWSHKQLQLLDVARICQHHCNLLMEVVCCPLQTDCSRRHRIAKHCACLVDYRSSGFALES